MYKKIIFYSVIFIVMGLIAWTITNRIFSNVVNRELQQSAETIEQLEFTSEIRYGIIEHLNKNERRHQDTIKQLEYELEGARNTIREQTKVIHAIKTSTGNRKATIKELIEIFDQSSEKFKNEK